MGNTGTRIEFRDASYEECKKAYDELDAEGKTMTFNEGIFNTCIITAPPQKHPNTNDQNSFVSKFWR